MKSDSLIFLNSLGFGVVLAFSYDPFRILRKVHKTGLFSEYVEDLVFWFIVTLETAIFLYGENNGKLRWFIVTGSILGIIVYEKTLGPINVRIFVFLLRKIKHYLSFIWKIVGIPIKSFKRWLKNAVELYRISLEHGPDREENVDDEQKKA